MAESDVVPDFLRPGIAALVVDLVRGRYEAIEQDGRAGRLTAAELREAVESYPATLVPLPEEAFEVGSDVYPREGSDPPEWAVDQDLWTLEEGRSDLTLELEVRFRAGEYRLEITSLHVM